MLLLEGDGGFVDISIQSGFDGFEWTEVMVRVSKSWDEISHSHRERKHSSPFLFFLIRISSRHRVCSCRDPDSALPCTFHLPFFSGFRGMGTLHHKHGG